MVPVILEMISSQLGNKYQDDKHWRRTTVWYDAEGPHSKVALHLLQQSKESLWRELLIHIFFTIPATPRNIFLKWYLTDFHIPRRCQRIFEDCEAEQSVIHKSFPESEHRSSLFYILCERRIKTIQAAGTWISLISENLSRLLSPTISHKILLRALTL